MITSATGWNASYHLKLRNGREQFVLRPVVAWREYAIEDNVDCEAGYRFVSGLIAVPKDATLQPAEHYICTLYKENLNEDEDEGEEETDVVGGDFEGYVPRDH